jgi:hypothetical protein
MGTMFAALSDPVLANRHFRPPCRCGYQHHEPSQHFVGRYAGKVCQIAHVEAKAFQNEWLRNHEGRQPLGWMLRESDGLPSVRFHALPGSKRYAENGSEHQTNLPRERPWCSLAW